MSKHFPPVGSLVVGDGVYNVLSSCPMDRLCAIVTRLSGYIGREEEYVHVYWLDSGVRSLGNGIDGGYFPERFRLVANQPQPITREALSQLGKDEFTDKMILAAMGITITEEED